MNRYAFRPTFRIGSILAGILLALGITILIQQWGGAEFTPLAFWLSVLLGAIGGLFWSWAAHGVAVKRANKGGRRHA